MFTPLLAEVLHELIDASGSHMTPNRRGELHTFIDQAVTDFKAATEHVATSAEDLAPVVEKIVVPLVEKAVAAALANAFKA